jgi:hypothetical protein
VSAERSEEEQEHKNEQEWELVKKEAAGYSIFEML